MQNLQNVRNYLDDMKIFVPVVFSQCLTNDLLF